MKNKLLLIVVFSFLFACSNPYPKETKIFKDYLQQKNNNLENKTYVILPLNICGSCVENMINMLNMYADPDKTIIVITDYTGVTIKNKAKELDKFKIIEDHKMSVVNSGLITGDKIVLIRVDNNAISEIVPYNVGENENVIKEIFKN